MLANYYQQLQMSRVQALTGALRLNGLPSIWRLLAFIFALINLKVLPLVWHIRLFSGLYKHLYRSSSLSRTPSTLFDPISVTSRTPVLECDYNFHKSNSTYFSDLDISRTHLVTSLLRTGLQRQRHRMKHGENGEYGEIEGKASVNIMLGGVTCSFKREIKPYQRFEVQTRVLCWDRKWLYLVSHFIDRSQCTVKAEAGIVNGGEESKKAHPAIFASSLSKYVFKQGRRTIPPETVLHASDLLPELPGKEKESVAEVLPALLEGTSLGKVESALGATLEHGEKESDAVEAEYALNAAPSSRPWDWQRIEQERLRGMKVASMMEGLEELHDEFTL